MASARVNVLVGSPLEPAPAAPVPCARGQARPPARRVRSARPAVLSPGPACTRPTATSGALGAGRSRPAGGAARAAGPLGRGGPGGGPATGRGGGRDERAG